MKNYGELKMMAGTTTLIQENHYYAFGMELEHTGFVGSMNMYRYNLPAPKFARQAGLPAPERARQAGGKEMINDFGLDSYDYGARYYGATIGRWGQMDPLAEEYQGLSPTIYTGNNPIRYIDPNGMYFTNGSQKYLTRLNKYMEDIIENYDKRISKAVTKGNDKRV